MKKTNITPSRKLSLNKRTIMKLNETMMLNLLGGSDGCDTTTNAPKSNMPRHECITVPTRLLDERTNCINGTTTATA